MSSKTYEPSLEKSIEDKKNHYSVKKNTIINLTKLINDFLIFVCNSIYLHLNYKSIHWYTFVQCNSTAA